MSWGKSCFVVGNVLWEFMYWWSACLQDGISYNLLCFIERYVLVGVMFYFRVYIIGGHVLLFEMSHWGTGLEGMSN